MPSVVSIVLASILTWFRIAVITQESVITRILRHLQLAAVPPPLAPARDRHALFAFA